MKCSQVRVELDSYVSNQLNTSQANLIKTHLKNCSGCNRELEYIKSINFMLDNIPLPDAPSDFTSKVMDRIYNTEHSKGSIVNFSLVRWGASFIAAGLLMLLLNSGYIDKYTQDSTNAIKPPAKKIVDIIDIPSHFEGFSKKIMGINEIFENSLFKIKDNDLEGGADYGL